MQEEKDLEYALLKEEEVKQKQECPTRLIAIFVLCAVVGALGFIVMGFDVYTKCEDCPGGYFAENPEATYCLHIEMPSVIFPRQCRAVHPYLFEGLGYIIVASALAFASMGLAKNK